MEIITQYKILLALIPIQNSISSALSFPQDLIILSLPGYLSGQLSNQEHHYQNNTPAFKNGRFGECP